MCAVCYGILGRDFIRNMVIYGVNVGFWPPLVTTAKEPYPSRCRFSDVPVRCTVQYGHGMVRYG